MNVACLWLIAPAMILSYPLTGIALSRYIGRRIIWSKFLGTIQNVSEAKLGLILTWPVAMPAFIWKVAVAKFL